jgi:hypothetical protein
MATSFPVLARADIDSLFKNVGFYLSTEAGIAKLVERLAQGLHVEGTRVRVSAGVVSKRHLDLFIWRQNCRGVKQTTHLHEVSKLRMRGIVPPFPTYIHVEVLN